jgi:hypothetical protein
MRRSRRSGALALAAAFFCVAVTAGAKVLTAPVTAAPWAIIAYGPLLRERVVVTDAQDNLRLMLAAPLPRTATDARVLRGRPRIELALFWGPQWAHLARSPAAVAQLQVEQANQRAWLFPARGGEASILVLDPPVEPDFAATLMARVIARDGLAMLSAHGIPTRVEP